MVITVEISMYPFHDAFRPLIRAFIRRLMQYHTLKVTPGPTSTVIHGGYQTVMECITEMLAWSQNTQGQSVFVAKFLPGYSP